MKNKLKLGVEENNQRLVDSLDHVLAPARLDGDIITLGILVIFRYKGRFKQTLKIGNEERQYR